MVTVKTWYLEIGMYVESLDIPLPPTAPNIKNFLITKEEHIQQLQKYCRTVDINVAKSEPVIRKNLMSYYKTHVVKQEAIWRHISEYNLNSAEAVYRDTLTTLREIWQDFKQHGSSDALKIKNCVLRLISEMNQNANALTLLGTLKSKQQDTVHHCLNVCILSILFGHHLGLKKSDLFDLAYGTLLHDIGEIHIAQTILDKHHRGLTSEEKRTLEQHPHYSSELLATIPDIPKNALKIARSHHERVNGKGYPDGLHDINIDYLVKIAAIVNVYEILINHPNSKTPASCANVLKSLYMMRDSYFDKDLVESFMRCLGAHPIGSVVELNNEAIAIVISSEPKKRLFPIVMIVKERDRDLVQPEIINLALFKSRLKIVRTLSPDAIGDIDPSEYLIKQMGMNW